MKYAIIKPRWKSVKVKKTESLGPVEFGLERHFQVKSYKYDPLSPKNPLCFGIGPLAGSAIPGTHRLIFVSRSPILGSLIIATMGGAGVALYHTGLDYISLEGGDKKYNVVALKREGDKLEKKFIKLDKERVNEIYFRGEGGFKGISALQHFIFKELKSWYGDSYFRILATGPASMLTNYGSIGSTVIENKKLQWGQEDYAGRGGLGSVMVQAHRTLAIVLGGDFEGDRFERSLRDMKVVNELFEKEFGKKAVEVWMKVTKKYRYDEDMGTGGTFGVNFCKLGPQFLFFNWTSTYIPIKKRRAVFEKLVKGWYWRRFQDEIIKTRSWRTCGEKCPVVCKKVNIIFKKDYEPYAANGPLIGIFNMEDAERIVSKVDEYGFDGVEIGNLLAWVMEARAKGLLTEKELGIDLKVYFDIDEYLKNPLMASHSNMLVADHLLNLIVTGEGIGWFLRRGVRHAADVLERRHKGIKDLALYTPYGKKDYGITPIMYWTPGVFAPLPMLILSKTYYKSDKFDPYEIGKAAAERTLVEIITDNFGICRFHRGWSEKIAPKLVSYVLGKEIDAEEMARELVRKLIEYEELAGMEPQYWESKRVKEVIRNFLVDMQNFVDDPELKRWVYKLGNSFERSMRQFWKEMMRGVKEVLYK